jgi:hypothetical protein
VARLWRSMRFHQARRKSNLAPPGRSIIHRNHQLKYGEDLRQYERTRRGDGRGSNQEDANLEVYSLTTLHIRADWHLSTSFSVDLSLTER